jgi:adenylylsulfate kinase
MAAGEFIEVFMDTPLEICEERDPKGLYKKARAGEMKGFTGIDDPYEVPQRPELVLDGSKKSPEILADEVIAYLQEHGILLS